MTTKIASTYRLTPETQQLIKLLSEKLNASLQGVVQIAVIELAQKYNVAVIARGK